MRQTIGQSRFTSRSKGMDLKVQHKYEPPVSQGRRHPHDKPRTAREYLETMKPKDHVDCTPEEANRFKPAAKRLGISITQEKVGARTIRVWKLPTKMDKGQTQH